MFSPRPDQPLLITPLTGTNIAIVQEQAQAAFNAGAEALEWRLDLWDLVQELFPAASADSHEAENAAERARLVATAVANALIDFPPLPVLLTLRSIAEGGQASFSLALTEEIIDCGAAAVDIELARFIAPPAGTLGHTGSRAAIEIADARPIGNEALIDLQAHAKRAGVQLVASAHNFDFTPDLGGLNATFKWLQSSNCPVVKLAVMPRNGQDVAHLIAASAEAAQQSAETDQAVISMSMGNLGKISRIATRVSGSAATFVVVDAEQASAPGQIDIKAITEFLDRIA